MFPVGSTALKSALEPLPDKDGRQLALERLKRFVSLLRFRRTARVGQPALGFRLPPESIHLYLPDDPKDANLPSVAFLPGAGLHDTQGLGPPVALEETADLYGPGTAVVRLGEYVEEFVIEVMAAKHAARRAIVAGLTTALRAQEESSALRLSLPDYFGAAASFALLGSSYLEEPAAVKNRRRAHLFVELRVPELAFVRIAKLRPEIQLHVVDGNLGLQAWLDELG